MSPVGLCHENNEGPSGCVINFYREISNIFLCCEDSRCSEKQGFRQEFEKRPWIGYWTMRAVKLIIEELMEQS